MARGLTRSLAQPLLTATGFHIFITVLLAAIFVLRLTLFPGASDDDAEQLVFSQLWAWAYKTNQPPLYTWLVLVWQDILGVGIAPVLAVKFLGLWGIYLLAYQAGRLACRDETFGALSGLSVLGVYYITWDSVMNYSQTVLVGAAALFTVYAVLRLEDRHRWRDYAILGLGIGLGLLAKYNYPLALLPILAGGLMHETIRRRLFSGRILFTILIAAVIALPHFTQTAVPGTFEEATNIRTPDFGTAAYFTGVLGGLWDGITSIVFFFLPLWALVLVFFWRTVLPVNSAKDRPARRFFEAEAVVFFVMLVVIIIVFSVTRVRNHWIMVLIPLVIYSVLRIKAQSPTKEQLSRYALALAALGIAVIVAMGVRYVTGPDSCRKCNFFNPYGDIARGLRDAGFTGGTIISNDRPNSLGGNLRRYFPNARIVSQRYPYFIPPERGKRGQCLLVWNTVRGPAERLRVDAITFANERLGADIPFAAPVAFVEAPIPGASETGKTLRLAYILTRDPAGQCR